MPVRVYNSPTWGPRHSTSSIPSMILKQKVLYLMLVCLLSLFFLSTWKVRYLVHYVLWLGCFSSPCIRLYPMSCSAALFCNSPCLLPSLFHIYSLFRWPRPVWWPRVALLSTVSRGPSPGYTWQQVKRFLFCSKQCCGSGSAWILFDFAVLGQINLVSCLSKKAFVPW